MVDKLSLANARFTYIHDDVDKFFPPHAVDIHHVIARRSLAKSVFIYLVAILVAYALFLHLQKGASIAVIIWYIVFGALLVKFHIRTSVVKESVIIVPAFGVQLETHYGSGRILRRFLPVSKILKPVLNECVTPVTCYWCLSLLVRDEEELTLVFKEFRPPMKMLVPIWKALCVAIDGNENHEPFRGEDG